MQRFEDFYDIRFGVPTEGLPSFSYIRVDAFARPYPREYGTIVPRDPASVTVYDVDVLIELLTAYILDVSNEHRIVGVRVIMKPDEMFREESLLDFFSGNIVMLCIRGGLAISCDGEPTTVYDELPIDRLTEWDTEILNDLANGLHDARPQRRVDLFKERFPSVMMGYVAPDVLDEPPAPPRSFFDVANDQVREVLEYYGIQPYSEIHSPRTSVYDLHSGAKITVNLGRVTVRAAKGLSVFRTKIETTKAIVIDVVRNEHRRKAGGPMVGERMFRSISQQLDSSVHDIEVEDDVLIAFKLDSKISLRYVGHSIIATFTIGKKSVIASLIYSADFDAFVSYLEKMLNATKATAWQPE